MSDEDSFPTTGAVRYGTRAPSEPPRGALAAPVEVDKPTDSEELGRHAYPPRERSSLDDPLLLQLSSMNEKLDTMVAQNRDLAGLGVEIGRLKDDSTATRLAVELLHEKPVKNGLSDVRVLVVEDEEYLLDWMEQALEDHGCKVLGTDSKQLAQSALATARGRRAFQVMIVDVHLPTARDGIELLRWTNAAFPEVKLIVTSGKELSDIPGLDVIPAIRLQKSFGVKELARAVYAAIGHHDPNADTERPEALEIELTPATPYRPESFLAGELAGPPHLEVVPPSPRNWDDDEPDTSAETPIAKKSEPPPKPAAE